MKSLIKNKKGQTMVEYGLLISLIAIACVAALVLLGPRIAQIFTNITNSL
jgi:pilus assembly protein Flp/PilA